MTSPWPLTTCHHSPWALIFRGGDAPGKRRSTRMAYLVGTVAPDGKAVAVTGYIMNNDMTNWTKHSRRMEWNDIYRRWRFQPSKIEIETQRKNLPPAFPAELVRRSPKGGLSAVASAKAEAR